MTIITFLAENLLQFSLAPKLSQSISLSKNTASYKLKEELAALIFENLVRDLHCNFFQHMLMVVSGQPMKNIQLDCSLFLRQIKEFAKYPTPGLERLFIFITHCQKSIDLFGH